MSAETPVQSVGGFSRTRLRFREWRGSRPFWAGLFTMLGGVPIAYFPYATLKLGTMSITMATTAGAGSLIIGVLLVTLGLTMWFQQATRTFAGVAAIILALVSLVVSNIGGFVVGFLLALTGGALAVSWAPGKPAAEQGATAGGQSGPDAGGAAGPAGDAPAAAPGEPAPPYFSKEAPQGGDAHGAGTENHDGGYRVR
ncbi:DUF6114 domain-containing protein [Streptomyces echinoruber]|uniref:Integral membrane protein n=1 Tax=Streptomyces echinoruber TaxID=68898 RepID=A0A918R044_9ACTN|nr:DUF6114 domain-containing protein [Streptomyces echinoruber]GGZ76819.1 hypothetical protein GCM10010389_13160 [Streptomyces echinoruber]